jgi:hypothetical protein
MTNPNPSSKTNSGGEQAPLEGIAPITVGNPAAPMSAFVIDQSHREEIPIDGGTSDSKIDAEPTSIPKPDAFDLSRFKSTRAAVLANVETLLTALPHHSISQAKDFVRLHPDEQNYWSSELCFVSVPIKGSKTDTEHLIVEELAMRFLPPARILRHRLALATKPHDRFFLCHVPTQNLDNSWNFTNVQGCERAKTLWTQLTSRKEEGVDAYKIDLSHDQDAFPPPKWPKQTLDQIIAVTFEGRMITTADHPGLLRLIGAKQAVS